ncbi:MAG: AraC family transcriptional regulator [Verrucomicrobiae bacterium]|nr:AraC family transcriptional regulator [Verrucomicrobiae bacterium]
MPFSEARKFQSQFFRQIPSLEPVLRLMSAAPNASFFVKNLDSRYVMCNEVHLVTYGLTQEEGLLGKAARDFFPKLLAEAYEANDRKVFETGKPLWNEVWLVPHIRGTPRWFVSSKTPLLDMTGEIIGLAGLMHPIATPEDQRTHFQELERVIGYLETGFVDEVTVESLAGIAGISVPHFNRRFRQLLRLSPMEYVLSLRIQEAQRQLVTSNRSIGEIAIGTGFCDQSHFTKRFRKVTGMTPLAYRKRFRG